MLVTLSVAVLFLIKEARRLRCVSWRGKTPCREIPIVSFLIIVEIPPSLILDYCSSPVHFVPQSLLQRKRFIRQMVRDVKRKTKGIIYRKINLHG